MGDGGIGDDVRAAIADLSGKQGAPTEAPAATPSAPTQPAATPTEPKTGPNRDEGGRFARKEEGAATTEAKAPEAKTEPPPAEARPAAPKRTPPTFIRPTLHEKWGGVDPEIQEELHRYAGVVGGALKERAEATKYAQRWQEALKPYAGVVGQDPVSYVSSLMETAQALDGPNGAAVIAHLVKSRNIDIRALAAALDGEAPPPAQQQRQQAPSFDPNAIVEQVYSQLQNRMAVEAFEKQAEFLDEPMPNGRERVRDVMANLIEKGVVSSLEEAYSMAVGAHPTVQEALRQRTAKGEAERHQAQAAQAKAASSSIRGEPVVVAPAQAEGGSVFDDVRASVALLSKQRR